MIDKQPIGPDYPCLVLPPEVIQTMREEGRTPGVDNHYEYLMEHLFGTPKPKGRKRKMTHAELVELQMELYRIERQCRNRSCDEESYEPHELMWYAHAAAIIRQVFPLVDDAQRKQGRREGRERARSNQSD